MDILGSILGQSDYKYKNTDVDKTDYTGAPQYAALGAQIGAHGAQYGNQTANLAGAALGSSAQINTGMADQTRANQNQLVGQLQSQANGTGPSLAAGILKQGTDRNLANAASLAATTGSDNPALALRQLAIGSTVQNQQLAQAVAQQRAQEQINAQGQLGAVLGNQRSQDFGQAQAQAGLDQQVGLANLANQQATGIFNAGAQNAVAQNNAQNALGFDNATGNVVNSGVGAQQAYYNQQIAQDQWRQQQEAQQAAANAGAFGKLLSGAAGAFGSVMTGGLSSMAGPALGALGSAVNDGAGANAGYGNGGNPNNPSQPNYANMRH